MKNNKPPSTCTAKDLLRHLINTIPEYDKYEDWYVMINEVNLTIELINSKTNEMSGIKACEICYGK